MHTTHATPAELKYLRSQLHIVTSALSDDGSKCGPRLQEWLDRVSALNNEILSDATAGIYCGSQGELITPLLAPFNKHCLVMQWYSQPDRPARVEVAYIS